MYNVYMKEKIFKLKCMYFSNNEVVIITNKAKEMSITFSELVRRILDAHIEKNYKK
jgi:ABC-type molybdate transport system substrate-binding protein